MLDFGHASLLGGRQRWTTWTGSCGPFVVLDGKEYGGYEATSDAVFSAGNGRVGWVAKVSFGQVVHVIDGVQHAAGCYNELLRVEVDLPEGEQR